MKSLILCVFSLFGVSIGTFLRAPVTLWPGSHLIPSLPVYQPHVRIQPVYEHNIATVYQPFLQNALVYQSQQPYALTPAQTVYQHYDRSIESLYGSCSNVITKEIELKFREAFYNKLTVIFRKTVQLSDAHFIYSPHLIWKALAALAEGSGGETREALFKLLELPEDKCTRQLFYQIVSSSESFSDDVAIDQKQFFIADTSIILNQNWVDLINSHKLINIAQVPYKSNPSEVAVWRNTFKAQLPNINLNGNSVILQSLDYQDVWNSAFSGATIVEEPFYDQKGEQIATLQYMKMRKVVRIAYIPGLNMKMMELPVGKHNRYRLLFALALNNRASRSSVDMLHGSIVFEAFENFKMSKEPIEVAIPRITMTSEVDLRNLLEELGIKALWEDTYATRNISSPAALPSSFIQRVTVTLSNGGVRPEAPEFKNIIGRISKHDLENNGTGLDPAVGTDFIANRPFLFGLFDTETAVCLFGSSFSKPSNYKFEIPVNGAKPVADNLETTEREEMEL